MQRTSRLAPPTARRFSLTCITGAPFRLPKITRSPNAAAVRREFVLETRMKSLYTLAGVAAALAVLSAPVAAEPDAAAAQKLAKASGCTKCHSVDKTKKGPPYKKTAEKMKGKPDAEAKVYEQITKDKKVKLEDGTEEDHGAVKSKDEAEIRNLVQWILAQ